MSDEYDELDDEESFDPGDDESEDELWDEEDEDESWDEEEDEGAGDDLTPVDIEDLEPPATEKPAESEGPDFRAIYRKSYGDGHMA